VLDFDADAILLDSFSKDQYGGSGKRFDWQIAQQVWTMIGCLYLAGGISIESVREAIQKVRPYAVDVCSSVESSPGKKDHELLRRFIAEAKRND
jgi:phosphoribosylanthranilate isomerase